MSLAITILTGISIGIISGVISAIVFIFFKNIFEKWKLVKKNPNIFKEIELNKEKQKEVKNAREKRFKFLRNRNELQNGFERTPKREFNPERTIRESSDKRNSPEQSGRVSVSDIEDNARHNKFTLRD